eukprot:2717001-Ditylum_brightwellii.AAC.2
MKNAKHTFYPLPVARIYLTLNKNIILSRHKDAINKAWCYKDYEKHLKWKYQWNGAEISDICSHTPTAIFKNSKFAYKRFLTCYIHNRLPVRGASYSTTHSDLCPLCQLSTETNKHFLQCKDNKEKWGNLCDKLTATYTNMQIDPVLRILINMALKNKDLQDTIKTHSVIEWKRYGKLIHKQSRIGWELGRFLHEWIQQQHQCIKTSMKNQTKQKDWLRRIITQIYSFAHIRWHYRCEQ